MQKFVNLINQRIFEIPHTYHFYFFKYNDKIELKVYDWKNYDHNDFYCTEDPTDLWKCVYPNTCTPYNQNTGIPF